MAKYADDRYVVVIIKLHSDHVLMQGLTCKSTFWGPHKEQVNQILEKELASITLRRNHGNIHLMTLCNEQMVGKTKY